RPCRPWMPCSTTSRTSLPPRSSSSKLVPMQSRAEFVHLHVHSEYSLLDGAAQLEKLVKKAKDLHFPAIALTDHGNLFGAIDFYLAAQKAGIKPIIGCERANHLTVLVRDLNGYRNLIKLVSKAYLEGFYYKPRVDKELLAQHASG